ncbi:integrase [Natrinema sp. CBA1119]|uniref:tyrosine-type recombinase/integrase n=1 Tax=Natrinema sp. CBA1119 TaxID=1608465 RepID=UPI000BF56EFF|nr:site-specific integrase [Natrinema sp. CBA1119]PGF14515.1 integrase [Natrinema sp. CBA1119]
MSEPEKVEGIVLIPGPSRKYLNERQLVAYKGHRKKYIKWLTRMGKDPEKLERYAHDTARNYASITDKFYRWAWDHRGGYTLDLEHDDADEYLQEQVFSDDEYSGSHLHNVKFTLKAYFRFRNDIDEWESEISISSPSGATQPKDYVTMDERKALREAVLEFGTVPAYAALSPEKRSEWKRFLARRYGKPMNEVSKDDWDRTNGFKYSSIVHTSFDAGLRPIEVGRAKTYWVDVENAALRIPEDESSKNEDNWTVILRHETAEYLARWLEEREMYDKYNDTDQLWLTRHSNPYSSSSLTYLIDSLCEIAEIDRSLSWYAIRHSTGTYMAREEDLAAAKSQLRHKSVETTMKYDQAPIEDRRNALDNMG